MKNRDGSNLWVTGIFAVCMCSFLLIWYGRFVPLGSSDLEQHFSLVDEIMKHGGVRPPPIPNLQTMVYYPPLAHWAAAIVGWIGGSGLVAIVLITITSLFLCYLLILRLTDSNRAVNAVLLIAAFFALKATRSFVGWEVVGNFFYPQLVADVVYFAMLLWLASSSEHALQTVAIVVTGAITMWLQPLVALHILAVGCVLITARCAKQWIETRRFPALLVLASIATAIASAAAFLLHPMFAVMKRIALNNGRLDFGYDHVMIVTVVLGTVACVNMGRWLTGRARREDGVLAAALLAATSLTLLQWLALKIAGDGSAYAIKKHMFLVVTLGVVNSIRLLVAFLPTGVQSRSLPSIATPLIAGVLSAVPLQSFTTPVAPLLHALDYANYAASYGFPMFSPGNTAYADKNASGPVRFLVSLTALQYPLTPKILPWQLGQLPTGMKYAMVRRSPEIDADCATQYAKTAEYSIVEATCLPYYLMDLTVDFRKAEDIRKYAAGGWLSPENWGMWSSGDKEAAVSIPLSGPIAGPYKLVVSGLTFVNETHPSQIVNVNVNGTQIVTWKFKKGDTLSEKSAEIPAALIKGGTMHISFTTPGAVSPKQIGASADTRILGFGIETINVRQVAR